jgi:hypothetical protein
MNEFDYINFNDCQESAFGYSGSDEKRSLMINDEYYMLKLSDKLEEDQGKPLQASYASAPVSEFIGCHIAQLIGLPAQKTILGTYDGHIAVACKDFILNNPEYRVVDWQLQEFAKMENTAIPSSERGRTPALENVEYIFSHHPILANIRKAARNRFWETFVLDALIGNFDRHSGNWGYLVNGVTGEVRLAPIYDCGSSLFARLAEDEMPAIVADEQLLDERVYNWPTAALTVKEKKLNYYDYLTSGGNEDCYEAVERIYPKIDIAAICELVDKTPLISDVKREFLKVMLTARYDKILTPAYKRQKER